VGNDQSTGLFTENGTQCDGFMNVVTDRAVGFTIVKIID